MMGVGGWRDADVGRGGYVVDARIYSYRASIDANLIREDWFEVQEQQHQT